jgi:hypothetical protein
LVIEIYEPYPARLRFQVQQGSKGLAGSRPVDVMTILQSKAEPVRQRRLAVNGRAMRQSRVALADATEPAGQPRQPRSQGSALVSQRKPFAWYPVPGASTASARQKWGGNIHALCLFESVPFEPSKKRANGAGRGEDRGVRPTILRRNIFVGSPPIKLLHLRLV